MRFMAMVRADKKYEAGLPVNPELMAAIGKLTEEHMKAGKVVANGGLFPTFTGALVSAAGGRISVTDGPFAETKELLGGFAILETESREEAIQLASEFMQVHADILGPEYEGACEVRQMFEGGDCGKIELQSRAHTAKG